jgi:hypothetical protein
MLQGHPFKAMKAVPGDLTFFNPRYVYHYVLGRGLELGVI